MDKQRIIEALEEVKSARDDMTDDQALNHTKLYPAWSANKPKYDYGSRVNYEGKLYRCIRGHTLDDPAWTPTGATSLWTEVLPGQDGTAIGEWKQPSSTNGYKYGDMVYHNGKKWRSTYDKEGTTGGNVWEPGAVGVYTWEEVTD